MKINAITLKSSELVFIVEERTIFGNQDTEKCPEEFCTDYTVLGSEVGSELEDDFGFDFDEIVEVLQEGEHSIKIIDDECVLVIDDLPECFYLDGGSPDMYSGNSSGYTLMTVPVKEAHLDVVSECPECYRKTVAVDETPELWVKCPECHGGFWVTGASEIHAFIKAGIICEDCGVKLLV